MVQDDIREKFKDWNFAIINGVLEWIPETKEVVVDKYYDKDKNKDKNYSIPNNKT